MRLREPLFMKALRERKYLVLLLLLVFLLAVQPLAHGLLLGMVLYDVLASLILLSVFIIVFERRQERLVALLIALPAVAVNWASYGLAGEPRVAAAVLFNGLVALLLAFAVTVILRGLFQKKVLRADHLLGSFCGYLLAGAAWGNLYLLTHILVPGAFSVKPELAALVADENSRRFLFHYFSFMTLTTAGYGDITPVHPVAATLATVEAVFGQLYLAVIVAQLIGLKLAQAASREEKTGE
jgi:hypothetical protein